MVFSSVRFFVFLALTLLLLAATKDVRRKKHLLALASCVFYAAWDVRYLGLLLLVSVIDYVCAARIAATSNEPRRKRWVLASIVSNLGILAYFKYTSFFIGTWNGVLGDLARVPALEVLLPAGISFYTFKSMSYTIDVYRREIEPCRSHLDYVTFITFFPELIAGPIVRASIFLPQMGRDIGPTRDRLWTGGSWFLLGLVKKTVIADRMATIADPLFAHPDRFDGITTWLGVAAYTIQIYADFSGYSDMAIGTAKLIGYDLPENFDMPYGSRNITEFWRRWHITLSSWLRDYLYIPLGGNRSGTLRTYGNLMATMLLGGLWHGASWNFVLWGGLHGGALAAHRALSRGGRRPLPPFVSIPSTLLFVALAWIPFRAASFRDTWTILRSMSGGATGSARFVHVAFFWCVPCLLAAHVIGERVLRRGAPSPAPSRILGLLGVDVRRDPVSGPSFVLDGRTFASVLLLWVLVLATLTTAEVSASPFIYFQF